MSSTDSKSHNTKSDKKSDPEKTAEPVIKGDYDVLFDMIEKRFKKNGIAVNTDKGERVIIKDEWLKAGEKFPPLSPDILQQIRGFEIRMAMVIEDKSDNCMLRLQNKVKKVLASDPFVIGNNLVTFGIYSPMYQVASDLKENEGTYLFEQKRSDVKW